MLHSLIEYARLHGLAIDHRSINPITVLEDTLHGTSSKQTAQKCRDTSFTELIAEDQICGIFKESLSITAAVSQRIQDAIDLPKCPAPLTVDRLPILDHRSIRSLKVQQPLLWLGGGDPRKDISRVRKSADIDLLLRAIKENLSTGENCKNMLVSTEIDLHNSMHSSLQTNYLGKLQVRSAVLERLSAALSSKIPHHECGQRSAFRFVPRTLVLEEYESDEERVTLPDFTPRQDDRILCSQGIQAEPSECVSPESSRRGTLKSSDQAVDLITKDNVLQVDWVGLINWDSSSSQPTLSSSTMSKSFDRTLMALADGQAADDESGVPVRTSALAKDLHIPVTDLSRDSVSELKLEATNLLPNYPRHTHKNRTGRDDIFKAMRSCLPLSSARLFVDEGVNDTSEYMQNRFKASEKPVSSQHFLPKPSELHVFDQSLLDNGTVELASEDDQDEAYTRTQQDPNAILLSTNNPNAPDNAPNSSQICDKHIATIPSSFCGEKLAQNIGLKRKASIDEPPFFSATSSLSTFLDLQGRRFKKLHPTVKHVAREVNSEPIESTQATSRTSSKNFKVSPKLSGRQYVEVSLPLPEALDLEMHCTIFVNTELLQTQSSLVSFLERRSTQGLTVLYRDFNSTFEAVPHLVVNPVSCLLITNFQSLMQRSLPGQNISTASSPLHQSIQRLSTSFERIFILILYQIQPEATASVSTYQTMAKLTAFCAGLSTSSPNLYVRPIWIQCTSSKNMTDYLNAHVWSLITNEMQLLQGIHDKSVKTLLQHAPTKALVQDETHWEVFLRRAGLNCMAAQIVLSILYKQEDLHSSTSQTQALPSSHPPVWGLPKLVTMSANERLELFGNVLGVRIARRLNYVLDGEE